MFKGLHTHVLWGRTGVFWDRTGVLWIIGAVFFIAPLQASAAAEDLVICEQTAVGYLQNCLGENRNQASVSGCWRESQSAYNACRKSVEDSNTAQLNTTQGTVAAPPAAAAASQSAPAQQTETSQKASSSTGSNSTSSGSTGSGSTNSNSINSEKEQERIKEARKIRNIM